MITSFKLSFSLKTKYIFVPVVLNLFPVPSKFPEHVRASCSPVGALGPASPTYQLLQGGGMRNLLSRSKKRGKIGKTKQEARRVPWQWTETSAVYTRTCLTWLVGKICNRCAFFKTSIACKTSNKKSSVRSVPK